MAISLGHERLHGSCLACDLPGVHESCFQSDPFQQGAQEAGHGGHMLATFVCVHANARLGRAIIMTFGFIQPLDEVCEVVSFIRDPFSVDRKGKQEATHAR